MGNIFIKLLLRDKTCASLSGCTYWQTSSINPFKCFLSELLVRVDPPKEGNVKKTNSTSETTGLVSQNRLTKYLDLDESGHSDV